MTVETEALIMSISIATNNKPHFNRVMRAIEWYDQVCTVIIEYGELRYKIWLSPALHKHLLDNGLIV